MKQLLLVPTLIWSITVFAGSPKTETKEASIAKTDDQQEANRQWFHFVGNATSTADRNNAAKYVPEDDAECPDAVPPYRCDVFAMLSLSNPNQPDLSTISEERTRSTATN